MNAAVNDLVAPPSSGLWETSLKIHSKFSLMLPFMITALSLSASVGMEFRVNPVSPTSADPVGLTVTVPGGHPGGGYISTATHDVSGTHIRINLVTTREPGDVFTLPIFPAVGSVVVGNLMPGRYSVVAHWYRSDWAGFPPTLRETATFDFSVGFGGVVPTLIANAVSLTFETEEGKTYQIYRSEDVDTWVAHGARIIGNGSEHRYYETTEGGSGFFRVVEVPQSSP